MVFFSKSLLLGIALLTPAAFGDPADNLRTLDKHDLLSKMAESRCEGSMHGEHQDAQGKRHLWDKTYSFQMLKYSKAEKSLEFRETEILNHDYQPASYTHVTDVKFKIYFRGSYEEGYCRSHKCPEGDHLIFGVYRDVTTVEGDRLMDLVGYLYFQKEPQKVVLRLNQFFRPMALEYVELPPMRWPMWADDFEMTCKNLKP